MEKHVQVNTILWIALLFTIITSIFSLPNRLSVLIVTNVGNGLSKFITTNVLWIIVVMAIIVVLIVNIKKSEQTSFVTILQNENIRIGTGILVALQGLINLSSTLPTYIISIQSLYKIPQSVGANMEKIIMRTLIVDIISVAIILCQIFFGVYLAKCYKKKID